MHYCQRRFDGGPWREQALEAGFDLLVVDEAHHGAKKKAVMIVTTWLKSLHRWCIIAYSNTWTAWCRKARLRLLDPQRFSSLERFLKRSISKLLKLQKYWCQMNSRAFNCFRRFIGSFNWREQRFRAIHELLDRHGTGRSVIRVKRFKASQAVIANLASARRLVKRR